MSGNTNTSAQVATSRRRIVLVVLVPASILILYGLTYIKPEQNIFREVLGLTASVLGLASVLLFYIFLYKYQKHSDADLQHRQIMLVFHAGSILVFFLGVQWLGLYSPWKSELLWGTYDLQDFAKVTTIGIISVGSLSLIGSIFNLLWKEYFSRASN